MIHERSISLIPVCIGKQLGNPMTSWPEREYTDTNSIDENLAIFIKIKIKNTYKV